MCFWRLTDKIEMHLWGWACEWVWTLAPSISHIHWNICKYSWWFSTFSSIQTVHSNVYTSLYRLHWNWKIELELQIGFPDQHRHTYIYTLWVASRAMTTCSWNLFDVFLCLCGTISCFFVCHIFLPIQKHATEILFMNQHIASEI